MRTFLLLLIVIVFATCGEEQSKLYELRTENDSLKTKVAELESLRAINKQEPASASRVTIADTDVKEITSRYNNQKYQIKISYPKNYFRHRKKKYPVLYILDAETNFGGVSYIVQRLIKDGLIPEVLVVGIAYNTDYDTFYSLRSRDLTPVEDRELRMGKNTADPTGGAPKFSDFLEFELFPFIDKAYRTRQAERAVYGHSYGGLYGSYVLLEKPHLFNKYLLLGPSLWFKDKLLINQLRNQDLNISQVTKLYMASGQLDLGINDYQVEFITLLKEKNLSDLDIKSEIVENETHRTIFGIGFTNGLRYIYQE